MVRIAADLSLVIEAVGAITTSSEEGEDSESCMD